MTNETKHTPTPWYWGDKSHYGYFNLSSESGLVITAEENYGAPYMDISEEDAAHIVKCVNIHDELVGALLRMKQWCEDEVCAELPCSSIDDVLKKAGAL